MKEKWLPLTGTLHYEISNFGRVRSIDHRVEHIGWSSRVTIQRDIKGRLKKTYIDRCGYEAVLLWDRSRHKYFGWWIHICVATHFVKKPKSNHKLQVNHKDLDKKNNHYMNLEWVTHVENMRHARVNGAFPDMTGRIRGSYKKKEIKFKHGVFTHPSNPDKKTRDPEKFILTLNKVSQAKK